MFRPGQDLAVAGVIGNAGVRLALETREDALSARFSKAFIKRAWEQVQETWGLSPELLAQCGATEWEYIGEGGIFAALWNLSGAYGQGISFELTRIPVRQETIEVCELFDLNPYRLASGGCVLAAADNGNDFVRHMEALGIPAAWIGKVEPGIARRVIGAGGVGFLERPQPDEIYKITGTQREEEENYARKNIGNYGKKQQD